ncbi:MAG: AAA family ATPase, partial [Clostridiales bacterium]|nr:AAA family ATPase [Clostridiales bacterium]
MEKITRRKIAFIGAMGSGKSVLARAYAARSGGTVCDTDELFTSRYGEINAYFEANGEAAFRNIEEELLIEAARSSADTIACGGGAVLCKRGMNALRAVCDIVLLNAPVEILRARIAATPRPLKADAERIIAERARLYERYADYRIDTNATVDVSVARITDALRTPRPNRYDVVLCDADDTVLDYQAAMRHSLTASARAVGIKCADERLISQYKIVSDDIWGRLERGEINHAELNGLRFKLLRERLCEDFDVEKMNDVYFDVMIKTRYTVDGAKEFLTELRGRGIKVYIATNAFERMARERLKA